MFRPLLIVFLALTVTCARPAAAKELTLTILHTNDLHARYLPITLSGKKVGGFARLATLVKKLRRPGTTLHVTAGDLFQGTVLFTHYRGVLGLELLQRMGLDAMTLGNHEFDLGVPALVKALKTARFPVLCANLVLPEGSALRRRLRPHLVIVRDGVKIGLIGLLTPEEEVFRRNLGLKIADPLAAAKRSVAALTRQGVRHIVVLSHLGLAWDHKLATQVSGIDVIVGGHTHTPLHQPVWLRSPSREPVLIVQAGSMSRFLGHVVAHFDARGVLDPKRSSARLIRIVASKGQPGYIEADRWFQTRIAKAESELGAWTRAIVGRSLTPLWHKGDRESPLGNLVTDAIRSMLNVDVAIANSGGIRRSIDAGPLTRGAIFEALPFENKLLVVHADAKLLRRMLEHSASIFFPSDPRQAGGQFLQLSGLRVRIARHKPVGQRIRSIEWRHNGAWKPLGPRDVVRLAVQDFIYHGGDGYRFFRGVPIRRTGKRLLRDLVTDYLKRHPKVAPRVEGRIRLE